MKRIALMICGVMLCLCSTVSTRAGDDLNTEKMEIGTNFWDIGWGGPDNQPFKTPWNHFVAEEDPWNPLFLSELEVYTCFRFMDWNKVNSVEKSWEQGKAWHRSWDSRVKPTDEVQNPMAYEWMIDLCNRTGKDMWVVVPHVVDDEYVSQLARLISQTLDPNLKCYVEWSNETWNGSFTQSRYVNEKGRELPEEILSRYKWRDNEWYRGQLYHAVRTLQIDKIFLDEFQGARDRLVLVMGGSMIHAFFRDSHCWAVNDPVANPHAIMPDAYAIAPYIGHSLDPGATDLFEQFLRTAIPERTKRVAEISETVSSLTRMKMIAYEGGQHLKHTDPKAMNAQHDPRMADVYRAMFQAYAPYLTHFNHYVHMGGAWGAKETLGDSIEDSPKYRVIQEWMNQ